MAKSKSNRVRLYLRCSTNHQDLDVQRHDLTAYAERRGWTVVEVYEDKGVSGAKDSRPALDRMMEAVRRGKVDTVLVWRFDRFARSLSHLISALHEFDALGVHFASVTENIDTTTPSGRLVFSIIGAIAEFERLLIQERVKAGVARAREKGVQFGRPRVGFDYKKALELRGDGWSLGRIARQMNVSTSTIWRLVTS